jgi:hypothetical protein
MSFHSSAENVRVDEGHLLRAQLRNMEGNLVDAELNLDQVLGNNFGIQISRLTPFLLLSNLGL